MKADSAFTGSEYFRLFLVFALAFFLIAPLFWACQKKTPESEKESEATTVISADGVQISYFEQGSGSPAIVFVHGWSCNHSYWSKQVEHFSQMYKVVTLDLAGHGQSGGTRKNYTISAFGADVAAVIKKLDLKKVVLVGHSMGGAVILEAARLVPDRILGLVGADTFQDFEIQYSEEEIGQFLAPFKENFTETTRDFVLNMFPLNADSSMVQNIINEMSAAPKDIALSTMANFLHYDAKPALQEVRIPIHLINCEIFPVNIEAGKRHAFSFEVTFIPEVGHFVMLEDPVSFNQLLEEVINKLTGKDI